MAPPQEAADAADDEPPPVAPDELIYRRLSVYLEHYDEKTKEVSPEAFNANSNDFHGLSVDRARSNRHPTFRTAAEAARGRQPGRYYVSVHHADALTKSGLHVKPDPIPDGQPGGPNPGHALIPQIYKHRDPKQDRRQRRSAEVKQWKRSLATPVEQPGGLCLRVEGPFEQ